MYICIYLLVYIGLLILLKNNKVLAVWVHLRGHDALVNFFCSFKHIWSMFVFIT